MPKLIDSFDAQSARSLRMAIQSRHDLIERIYPKVGTPERTKALEDLIHLVNELGLDCEALGFYSDDGHQDATTEREVGK